LYREVFKKFTGEKSGRENCGMICEISQDDAKFLHRKCNAHILRKFLGKYTFC